MTVISKGSEWHIWDLHFHTPSSYDYKHKDGTNQEIIQKLKENNVKVVAITDHHVIDVERITELQRLGVSEGITVLPGIEFLADARGREPVHFIGIFSENSNMEHIWGQIKHRTDINKIELNGIRENQVYCDLLETINLVKELGGLVTIHAGDKHGSVENITHSLPHTMAQKTEVAHAVDIYELGKEEDQQGYIQYVFPTIKKIIPMIICSDNHNIRNYEIKQKLWIKGEPSFNGLKYALNEPQERFYIGEEPEILKRTRENKTKYISSLKISLDGIHDKNNIWFDNVEIPLNSELVTIIGHKGNGKSAISDILALCADGEHSGEYLFLHKDKFKKRGLAERFKASIEFLSNFKTSERKLNHTIDPTQQSLVRYLPQSYFEKVCNEIGKVEAFREEIEKVVYRYVPKEKKMGAESFRDLLDLKKKAIEAEIASILERLRACNKQIISLEDQNDPAFKESLKSKIKVKKEELETHRLNKPTEILDPSLVSQSPENERKKAELLQHEKNRDDQITLKNHYEQNLKNCNRTKLEVENLIREINNKVGELKSCLENGLKLFEELEINKIDILNINFSENILRTKIAELDIKINEYIALLDEANHESPIFKINEYQSLIESITSAFTGEQKAYQAYTDAIKEWHFKETEIIGSIEEVDSLTFLENKLNYIEHQLLIDLSLQRNAWLEIVKEIYKKKAEIKNIYDEVKNGIDKQLAESAVSELNIASKLDCDQYFKKKLLSNIRQNKVGSFYGGEDGGRILQDDLISQTDWNDEESVISFLENFIYYLEHDMRNNERKKIYIGGITQDRFELYDYIFGLHFLNEHYDLQNNGKSLDQLSPGEKGALLLVFYLVLDKEDIPLIIDQPEDNLDNNSVAKVLVPFIKLAKKKRQIILVTHNPNLAVVADSEQVINVSLDKQNGYKFNFISGGIENQTINKQLLEVLEGTIPAFCLRKDKYSIN
ncbi:TPA: TrlF family AAA-like ATPase [Acinetobacter baumannii]|uniref:TrlF family AAA-like ATPase n=1 Tax=Acinetobacter baumannii TaxID=470 RepID=UPI00338FE544